MNKITGNIVVVITLVFSSFSCGKQDSSTPDTIDLIESPGIHQMPDGFVIKVVIAPDHVIEYRVMDSDRKVVLESNERASAFQRWCLYWDEGTRILWFNSDDVGVFTWIPDKTGKYQKVCIGTNTPQLIKDMPNSFFKKIASTLQNTFSQYR